MEDCMTPPKPAEEHQWLQQLVGDWTMVGTALTPDGGTMESTGKENVSSLGGLWIIGQGEGSMPDGTAAQMRLTVGFDPAKGKFIGSWVGSMMTSQWVYEGELDEARKVLTLNTEGPGFEDGVISKYRDVHEIIDDDHRVLTSHAQGKDGEWTQFMRADYYRVK